MSYIDASEVVRKAVVTTLKGLGYTVNGNEFPRVEVMSVTSSFGIDKDNERNSQKRRHFQINPHP